MKAALALLVILGGLYPGEAFPGGRRQVVGEEGSGDSRRLTLDLTLDDDDAVAPFQPVVTARVRGYFGTERFHFTCFDGDEEKVTPDTFGSECEDGNGTCYLLDNVCGPYVDAGEYDITVWIERIGEIAATDTTTLTITEDTAPGGNVAIALSGVTEETCTIPCPDLGASVLAYNFDTDVTLKTDLDESCASSTTDCGDGCWETRAADDTDGLITGAALPDISGVGIKNLRICVIDERPSSAYASVAFTALSGAQSLVCTASLDPIGGSSNPTDNVEPTIDCSGGTSADGCDITADCDIDTAGGSTTLTTNSFETTGADGCDDITTTSGTTSCAGGTAQAGTGAGTTNAIFFHTKYASAPEQIATLDDLTIITDSSNSNQRRWNLRDDATNCYMLGTANPSTNSLRLECPGNTCTTAAGQYTDGVPFDVRIHVLDTATGLASIENAAGDTLCTCAGTSACEVNGYVLNGGQAVVSIGGYTVTTPTGASDLTPVSANTTWPYNWTDEATEDCDGYATGTTTARFTVDCPDSEVQVLDVPFTVAATPTFSIDSVTVDLGASCTLPDCIMREITLVYSGTATGTVSGIACTLINGTEPAQLTTTTDAASPFALAANGGWPGVEYTQAGTYQIRCEATREGVTASRSVSIVASDQATPVADLQMSPPSISRTTTPGGSPTADTIAVDDATDGAIPFTCAESPPRDWLSVSSCCAETPASLTVTYSTTTLAAGTYDTSIVCSNDDEPTDTATTAVTVVVSSPAQGDPTWSTGRDGQGRLLINAGSSYGTVAMKLDHRPGTSSSELHFNQFDIGHPNSMVFRNSQLLNNYAADPNGTNIGNDKDTMRFAFGAVADQMKYLLLKSVTVKNAQFTGTGPHADVFQIIGLQSGVGNRFLFEALVAQNFYFANSDSRQGIWATTMESESGKPFTYFVLHEGTITQESAYTTQCNLRGSGGTRSCGQPIRVNMPYNPTGTMYRWVVAVDGSFTMEGGSATECQDDPLIMIQTTGTILSTACIPTNLRFTYPNIEAALAAGHPEPPFMRLTCGGWANPPAGCITGKGYVASN